MSAEPVWNDPEQEYRARRSRGPGPGLRWAESLLLVFGVVLGLAVLEGGARWVRRSQLDKGGYSPVRGHRSREPMNAAGYRDVEHTKEKPPGTRRVVFLGDSFTYGVGILLDDTYAKRTERGLAIARSEPWESVVLAVPGIDSEEERRIFEDEGLSYSPDLVVLGYVLNDAEDADAAEQRRAKEWTEAEAEKHDPPLWRRSALLSLIVERLHATRENRARIRNHLDLYREGQRGFASARKSIDAMAALCRERGIPFVVVVFPLFANPLDDRYPFVSIHEKVGAVVRSAGATLVDLLPYYRGMDWHLLVVEGEKDEHPNELAHRIAAQALLAALESIPLPPPQPIPKPVPRVH